MAEILTESFCERCGTRYTFESPARRSNPLGALGTVGRGLRNFVASPDQTIDEAFAVARAESEQRTTAQQLEAFHRTFNFCLSCRQYTCGNCWNPVEGRCQSCAPMPEAEMLSAFEVAATADSPVVAEAMAIARAAAVPVIEIPEAAVEPEPAEPEAGIEPELDAPAAFGSLAIEDIDVAMTDVEAREAETGREASAVVVEPEPVLAEPEPEPEREEIAAEREPEPEPEEIAREPEPVLSAPELVAGEPAPAEQSAPVAARDEAPVAEPEVSRQRASTFPDFPPGVSLDEEIAAYEVRVAAITAPPPAAGMDAVKLPPVFVAAAVPELPPASPVAMPAAQTSGTCSSCGLSVSATARFCRRCGTPQPTT